MPKKLSQPQQRMLDYMRDHDGQACAADFGTGLSAIAFERTLESLRKLNFVKPAFGLYGHRLPGTFNLTNRS